MMRRGFTVVELIITITIMAILLILAVVNVNATQLNARDTERKSDVEAIATSLESFFKTGVDGSSTLGRYPTTAVNASEAIMTTTLRDIDPKVLRAPGITDPTQTFKAASSNAAQTPTKDEYIYQPLLSSGALCTGSAGTEDCRRFNIFYRLEVDNVVYTIRSRNQ